MTSHSSNFEQYHVHENKCHASLCWHWRGGKIRGTLSQPRTEFECAHCACIATPAPTDACSDAGVHARFKCNSQQQQKNEPHSVRLELTHLSVHTSSASLAGVRLNHSATSAQ